jgi:hypothetical protein
MQTDRSNRPRLDDISAMPVGEIAKLPADQLALLQDDAAAALEAAKHFKDWIDGAIALRYAEQAARLRQQHGKDTGTVRFEDGDVTVVAELPKKVDWDQVALGQLVERIKAGGDDPREYVDITFKVPERKYAAWPSHIRSSFETARTVRTGAPSFRLNLDRRGQA